MLGEKMLGDTALCGGIERDAMLEEQERMQLTRDTEAHHARMTENAAFALRSYLAGKPSLSMMNGTGLDVVAPALAEPIG